ncbi:hypothetical protein ES708_09758 [subsurface metagenome]
MNRIRTFRGEIDAGFAELNTAIGENDLENIVTLIDKLEDLNPYPNEAEAELLDMLRAAGVEQLYFVNRFRDIMARAKAQIDAGRYRQAITIYLEGFEINKDRFDKAGYGNILANSVNTALGNMRQSIDDFLALSSNLDQEDTLISAEGEALNQAAAAVAADLESMMVGKGTVDSSGLTFQVLNTQIRDNSADDEYDLFLFFAGQLVFGPRDSATEGIANALDAIWRQDSTSLESGLLQRGETAYAAVVEEFRTQSMDQALESVVEAGALFTALLDLQALWPLRVAPTRSYPPGESGQTAIDAALPAFLRTQEYLEALGDYRSLIETSQRTSVLEEKEVTTTAQIFEDREELVDLIQQTTSLDSAWQQQLAFYTNGAGVGYSLNNHAAQAREVIADINGTLAAIEALDMRLLDRVARVQGVKFEERFQRYKASFEEGVRLQEGVEAALEPIRDEDGQIVEIPVRTEQFPSRAVAIFQPLVTDLEELAEGAGGMLENTLQNREYLDRSEELQIHVRSLESLVDRTAQLQEELARRFEDARQAALQAERYRREGLLRYQQAQANVNNERYAEARLNIQTAREAFDNSMSFQEDPEVRRIRDEDLVVLSRAIINRERTDPIHQLFRRVEAVRVLFDDLGQQQDGLIVAFLFDKLLHLRQAFPRLPFRPTASLDADRRNQTEDKSQENDFSLYRRRIQRCFCPQNRFEDYFRLLYYSLYHYRRKISGYVQRNVETTDSLASGWSFLKPWKVAHFGCIFSIDEEDFAARYSSLSLEPSGVRGFFRLLLQSQRIVVSICRSQHGIDGFSHLADPPGRKARRHGYGLHRRSLGFGVPGGQSFGQLFHGDHRAFLLSPQLDRRFQSRRGRVYDPLR